MLSLLKIDSSGHSSIEVLSYQLSKSSTLSIAPSDYVGKKADVTVL